MKFVAILLVLFSLASIASDLESYKAYKSKLINMESIPQNLAEMEVTLIDSKLKVPEGVKKPNYYFHLINIEKAFLEENYDEEYAEIMLKRFFENIPSDRTNPKQAFVALRRISKEMKEKDIRDVIKEVGVDNVKVTLQKLINACFLENNRDACANPDSELNTMLSELYDQVSMLGTYDNNLVPLLDDLYYIQSYLANNEGISFKESLSNSLGVNNKEEDRGSNNDHESKSSKQGSFAN